MRALFIPDDHGQGHIVRCGALVEEFQNRGWETFTIGQREVIPNKLFALAVFDLREYAPPLPGIRHTVRIIDDGGNPPGPADLVVIGNAGFPSASISEAGMLLGPQYALLRPEFKASRLVNRLVARVREGIFDARLVAGWTASGMAGHMAGAKVVITYAGMRSLEAACVGTPTVLVHRNRGEKLNAEGLATAGCGVISTEDGAMSAAMKMLKHASMLEEMGRKALALVDGQGCKRVTDAIDDMMARK